MTGPSVIKDTEHTREKERERAQCSMELWHRYMDRNGPDCFERACNATLPAARERDHADASPRAPCQEGSSILSAGAPAAGPVQGKATSQPPLLAKYTS